MLNHIYIDNYKCFVNFDYKPESLQLLLGVNGSGKTSVFDVLETLRDFVCHGMKSTDAFPPRSLTAWDTRSEQVFELGIEGMGGQYLYRLVIEHHIARTESRIKSERLTFDQKPVFEFFDKSSHLYNDDFSEGPIWPCERSRSAISIIPEGANFKRLTWFRERLSRVYVFSPDPLGMTSTSEREVVIADRLLHGIVSWLRHLSQESVETMSRLLAYLRDDVFEGLRNVKLEKVSERTRSLKFEFESSSSGETRPFCLSLEQLSTGQRNLVALYTVLVAAITKDTTVCIDEPDNYVALREIQPWLTELRDRVEDIDGQCLLISHHPESINYLAPSHGVLFHRDESGPVRVKPFEYDGEEAITPAELIARGWE